MTRSYFLFYFLVGFFLGGCSHTLHHLHQKPYAVFRFQNMLGLQTQAAGCSLGSLGGLSLMEEYAKSHPVDFSFQVGPAFVPILSGPFSKEELDEERKKVWASFKKQKISFYAVDAGDLLSKPERFIDMARSNGINLLSSNLIDKNKKAPLFKTEVLLTIDRKKVAIVALSEPISGLSGSEGFFIEPPTTSFPKMLKHFSADTEAVFVLGALRKETRQALSLLTKTPILFLGGTSQERNTTRLEALGSGHFFGRSPAFGTGFSEVVIGNFERDALGKVPQVQLGKFKASLYSGTLSKEEKGGAQCVPSSTQQ